MDQVIWDALSDIDVDHLAQRERNHRRLTGTRLRLSNHITAANDGDDCSLLNGRRLLEAVVVETPKQILLQSHLVEGGHDYRSTR